MRNIDARGLRHRRLVFATSLLCAYLQHSSPHTTVQLSSVQRNFGRAVRLGDTQRRHPSRPPRFPDQYPPQLISTLAYGVGGCTYNVVVLAWVRKRRARGSSLPSVGYYFAISLIPIFRLIIIPRSVRWIMCPDLSTNQFAFRSGTKRAVGVSTTNAIGDMLFVCATAIVAWIYLCEAAISLLLSALPSFEFNISFIIFLLVHQIPGTFIARI